MSEIKQEMRTRIDTDVPSFLNQFKYIDGTDSYVDIVDFVHQHGFTVVNADLGEKDDGFIAITSDFKLIAVNAKRSLEWKRFIIAHEFGHYVLHPVKGKDYLYRKRENVKGKNETENAADYFAAALLMPVKSFREEYKKLKKKNLSENAICMQLSSIFKVPLESVARRIQETSSEALQ